MRRLLFLCSRNRRRSPTAERLFAADPSLEVASAGLAPDADEILTPDHLDGVDIVFVMEPVHRRRLTAGFKRHMNGVRIVCLNIPDDYDYIDPRLVALLETRVRPHLKRRTARTEGEKP